MDMEAGEADTTVGTIEDTMAGVIMGVIAGAITHIGDYGDGDIGDGLFLPPAFSEENWSFAIQTTHHSRPCANAIFHNLFIEVFQQFLMEPIRGFKMRNMPHAWQLN